MLQGNLSMLCDFKKLFFTYNSTTAANDAFVTTRVATIPALKVLHLAGVHTLPDLSNTTSAQSLAVGDLWCNDRYNAKRAGQLVPAQDLTTLSMILFDYVAGMMPPFWRSHWSFLEVLPALRTLTVTEADLSALCWDDCALTINLRRLALQDC